MVRDYQTAMEWQNSRATDASSVVLGKVAVTRPPDWDLRTGF